MCTRLLVAALSLLFMVAAGRTARGSEAIFPYEIHQTTLDNALRVVVIPYDSPGLVAYVTVVRTGSRDEVEPGHSGFAHFFEHMMFRGTENYPQDVYDEILKRMGADSSGNTSDDRTVYYIIGPADEVETMMKLESDRFKNLSYSEDDFRTEALAVLGEYNKNASNPFLPMWEKLRDLAFDKHTYKHTTIGFLEDIKAMPGYYDYSLSFFDRFYRPENCVLLVIGDVAPERIFSMAKAYYGDWKKGYEPPKITAEPPQAGLEEAHLGWPSEIRPHLMMGYHAPAFSDDTVETAALDVIGQLLFADSAPLYQKLVVEEQWVDFFTGGYFDHRDPFLFLVYSRIKNEELVPKVRQAFGQEIAKLQSELVDVRRLERIKSYLRYSFALGMDNPESIALTMAHYLNLTGNPQTINRIYRQYEKVTPDDVQRLAKRVFQPERLTVVTLSQPGAQETPAKPAAAEGR